MLQAKKQQRHQHQGSGVSLRLPLVGVPDCSTVQVDQTLPLCLPAPLFHLYLATTNFSIVSKVSLTPPSALVLVARTR